MKRAPKSITELVVALKKAVNAPFPATKAGEQRWGNRVSKAMERLAMRLIDA